MNSHTGKFSYIQCTTIWSVISCIHWQHSIHCEWIDAFGRFHSNSIAEKVCTSDCGKKVICHLTIELSESLQVCKISKIMWFYSEIPPSRYRSSSSFHKKKCWTEIAVKPALELEQSLFSNCWAEIKWLKVFDTQLSMCWIELSIWLVLSESIVFLSLGIAIKSV